MTAIERAEMMLLAMAATGIDQQVVMEAELTELVRLAKMGERALRAYSQGTAIADLDYIVCGEGS